MITIVCDGCGAKIRKTLTLQDAVDCLNYDLELDSVDYCAKCEDARKLAAQEELQRWARKFTIELKEKWE